MATAGEGGATESTTTTNTNSSYSGGGAGGKFRKKPFRRPTTPYDRPPTLLRTNNDGSWLKKLVVDSASKFISYGANRFFAPLFRKRLTPPPPPPPELNHDTSEGLQGMIPNEHQDSEYSQPINSSSSKGISELEQLLKQKTFTRSEIDHLTDLLQSRAVEASIGNERKNNAVVSSDSGRVQQFGCGPSNQIGNGVNRSNGFTSTPILSSKVIEDNVVSPAELAKAYMGKRPSNVSPPMLAAPSQVGMVHAPLLNSTIFALKSPMTAKTSVKLGAPENGFITPRSRGRSAIYNMARTPYSRVHPTSILKGNGFSSNGYAGPSMASSSLSFLEPAEKFESNSITLKRRSSVLDEEIGSVGPIRRIRQKPNLLAPRISHNSPKLGIDSAKQKLRLIGDPKHTTSKGVEKDEYESTPSTSYARVPAKSSKVAARILQHLENLTPVGKPSESRLVAVQDKPFQLKPSMLRGRALRSMDNVDSFELPLDVQADNKMQDLANVEPDSCDSTSQKQGKVEENGPKESLVPSDKWYPAKNNDSSVSLKASIPSTPINDLTVRNNESQPPQKKRAFRMSFQEDSFEQYDDLHSNGVTPGPNGETKGPSDVSLVDNLTPAKEPKLVNPTTQPEVISPSGLVPSKTIESGDAGSVKVGVGSSGIAFGAPAEVSAPFPSAVSSLPAAVSDKPKEANNPPTFFFGTKVSEKVPSWHPESSTKMPDSDVESSSGLTNIPAPIYSLLKTDESDKDGHVNPLKLADGFEKSETGPSVASNEPLVSRPFAFSFGAGSSNATNQTSIGNSQSSTSPTNILNFFTTGNGTSASTTSVGSMFGAATVPATSIAPAITFGASVDPSTAVSAPSTAKISEVADVLTKSERDQSSSISQPTVAAFSGSSMFGLAAPANPSTENNLQGSLFSRAPVESVPFASLPSFTMNSSTSFGSSQSFGFSSSALLSDASKTASSLPKLGASSTAVSDGTAVGFGLSSSSSSTTAVGSVSAPAAAPVFSFGVNASVPASVNSTSSSSSSTSVFKFGDSSSTPAPAINFGGNSLAPASAINFGGSSAPASTINFGGSSSVPSSVINTSSSSNATSGIFSFGASSSASDTSSSNIAPALSNPFGGTGSWQNPNSSSIFGSLSSSPSQSTGFVFGSSSMSSAPANAAPVFPFAASSPLPTMPTLSPAQPTFGNFGSGFAASPGNNYQMNAEDSMAEDNPVQQQQQAPAPVFGQLPVNTSQPAFMFGQTAPTQVSPFQFNPQQNQVAPVNPNPFQSSGSLEFKAGGSFSLGSGGGDKSGRKFIKASRTRNRKK